MLEIIGTYSPQLKQYHSPVIIASFGASAVLLYGTIDAPLAQPRNCFCGHVIGAVTGVILSVLLTELPTNWSSPEQEAAVRWVVGATAMALTLVLMQLTVTVHPPGGATALIAVVDNTVRSMRWYYIGIVAMSAAVQLVVACLVNNVERKYPSYWWTPEKLPVPIQASTMSTIVPMPSPHNDDHHHAKMEQVVVDVDIDVPQTVDDHQHQQQRHGNDTTSSSSSLSVCTQDTTVAMPRKNARIVIDPAHPLVFADNLALTPEDVAQLQAIHAKLARSQN
ncbi:HPP family-domain-containing protein [Gongronella butleri]|nr:HPP family-domain-containing protein [Gongronella butleri]